MKMYFTCSQYRMKKVMIVKWSRSHDQIGNNAKNAQNLKKSHLFQNHCANQSQFLCGTFLEKENESTYKWSRSHDQDGRRAKK